MKNLMWITGLLFLSVAFTGCGSKKNDTNAPVNLACPVGQYYSNGRCYGGTGVVGNSQINFNKGFYADNYSGTTRITVVNSLKMKDLFKFGMGVCDRAGGNIGQANCDSYLAGSLDIVIQFPQGGAANTMMATFIARPKYNANYNYTGQYPTSTEGIFGAILGVTTGIWLPDPQYYTGAYRNPLQLQMVVSAINNSAGFEARGYGDYWTGLNTTVLAIQVPQGKVEDNTFNFNLNVQGTAAAQGTMSRCQLLNCGL